MSLLKQRGVPCQGGAIAPYCHTHLHYAKTSQTNTEDMKLSHMDGQWSHGRHLHARLHHHLLLLVCKEIVLLGLLLDLHLHLARTTTTTALHAPHVLHVLHTLHVLHILQALPSELVSSPHLTHLTDSAHCAHVCRQLQVVGHVHVVG